MKRTFSACLLGTALWTIAALPQSTGAAEQPPVFSTTLIHSDAPGGRHIHGLHVKITWSPLANRQPVMLGVDQMPLPPTVEDAIRQPVTLGVDEMPLPPRVNIEKRQPDTPGVNEMPLPPTVEAANRPAYMLGVDEMPLPPAIEETPSRFVVVLLNDSATDATAVALTTDNSSSSVPLVGDESGTANFLLPFDAAARPLPRLKLRVLSAPSVIDAPTFEWDPAQCTLDTFDHGDTRHAALLRELDVEHSTVWVASLVEPALERFIRETGAATAASDFEEAVSAQALSQYALERAVGLWLDENSMPVRRTRLTRRGRTDNDRKRASGRTPTNELIRQSVVQALTHALVAFVGLGILSWTALAFKHAPKDDVANEASGRTAPTLVTGNEPSLRDIVGLEDVTSKLITHVIMPLRASHLYANAPKLVTPPKGVLLYGPPGCGKTSIARALAKASNATFFHVRLGELLSHYHGASEKNIMRIFEAAAQQRPAIIFIDEADSLLGSREKATSDVHMSVKSALLSAWGGFEDQPGLVVLAATNRIEALDPAFLRRLPLKIEIPLMDAAGRRELFQRHLSTVQVAGDVQIDALVRLSDGMSASDVTELCRHAFLRPYSELALSLYVQDATGGDKPVRQRARPVAMADFHDGLDAMQRSLDPPPGDPIARSTQSAQKFQVDPMAFELAEQLQAHPEWSEQRKRLFAAQVLRQVQ